ncbi:MAG TPA: methylenetetrahydrofolate reductase [Xanthobacteraceae bacterium]|nr:methylenetetrahydrofolate reductase [Xanthobacteraceae bacterium]
MPVKPAAGELEKALASGRFVMTAEVTPPVTCEPQDLLARAQPLKDLADAVNVTDGAGARAHLGALAAAVILRQNGIEPVLQMTCRDRNRLALQSDLLGAAALGINNLLVLRGDDPTAGDQPDAKPVFDLDSGGLIATAVGIRERHELPSGRKVTGAANFFIGAADMPIDPPKGWQPKSLKAKIEAGAQFAQTQFCMDIDIVRRYVARLAQDKLTARISLLIGVVPLRSGKSARWIKEQLFGAIIPDHLVERLEYSGDPAAEGKQICIDFIAQLSEVPGVAGAHIMAPNNEGAIPDVIAKARKLVKNRALAS